MAKLTLQIGQFTATQTANDGSAARILRGFLTEHGHDIDSMTNQEQVEAVIVETVKFYNEAATAHEANKAANEARAGVIASPPAFE